MAICTKFREILDPKKALTQAKEVGAELKRDGIEQGGNYGSVPNNIGQRSKQKK